MRIGVNALPMCESMGGLRQYFQRLFRELLTNDLTNDYIFYYHSGNIAELELIGVDRWRNGAVMLCNQDEILRHLGSIDVYFCPFHVLWPRPLPVASVVMLSDIQEVYYPQFFTPEALEWRRLNYAGSTRVADAVVTVSEFSRQTIVEQHHVNPEKVFVAYHASDETFHESVSVKDIECMGLPERFVFYPANHWQHKNHDALLRAICLLRDEESVSIPLVLTGHPGENCYPLNQQIAEYGLENLVQYVGYVSADMMHQLYQQATLLCFPSLFEGFGMPVLEGMASGCPVACSNTTSLPEVVGDAAITFNPTDCRDIARAIMSIWNKETLRAELIRKGRQRARQFTTIKMATAHMQAFEYALKTFLPESRNVYQQYLFEPLDKLEQDSAIQRLQFEKSFSWRITSPLRWLGDKIRAIYR